MLVCFMVGIRLDVRPTSDRLCFCMFHASSTALAEAKEGRLTQLRRRCSVEGDRFCCSFVNIDNCNLTLLMMCFAADIFQRPGVRRCEHIPCGSLFWVLPRDSSKRTSQIGPSTSAGMTGSLWIDFLVDWFDVESSCDGDARNDFLEHI